MACSKHWREINTSLIRKREGKKPLGRTIHRWKDNNKMGLKEVGWKREEWTHLA
jgi:hypothetical protein